MAKPYKQKDLGYKRKPTAARLIVEFSNGERWAVPVQLIVDDRDTHYADEKEDTAGFIARGSLDDYEVTDWANNNMNWSDVSEYAEKVGGGKAVDYEDEWCNAEKEVE